MVSTTGGYWRFLTAQFTASEHENELSDRYYPERPMNIRELLQYIMLNCDAFIGNLYDREILHPGRMKTLANRNYSSVGIKRKGVYGMLNTLAIL